MTTICMVRNLKVTRRTISNLHLDPDQADIFHRTFLSMVVIKLCLLDLWHFCCNAVCRALGKRHKSIASTLKKSGLDVVVVVVKSYVSVSDIYDPGLERPEQYFRYFCGVCVSFSMLLIRINQYSVAITSNKIKVTEQKQNN